MAANLDLLSLAQLQKLAQQQNQPSSMWNNWTLRHPPSPSDEDSWEVRAFARDTGNAMWPPRSYTCTFCHREFRTAQALGGHMNVHRRDRAKLRQSPPEPDERKSPYITPEPSTPSPPNNNGLCLFYPIVNAPSTHLSMSNYHETQVLDLLAGSMGLENGGGRERMVADEIDLELRLGR